jgi:dienelactone hydrolase
MNARRGLAALSVVLLLGQVSWAQAPAENQKRRDELDRLLRVLPKSAAWEKWLKSSGELPPDFDALPRVAELPDALRLEDKGQTRAITDARDWPARREQLVKLFQQYVFGSLPPPPGNVRAVVRGSRDEAGATVQDLLLEFGLDRQAKLGMELLIPRGQGPFPVFLVQRTHRAWALLALSRGYIGCVYDGDDSRDDTNGFVPLWPDQDWGRLARRAWAASRCVDYLVTLAQVDAQRICIAGHSRNGKVALLAAALDPRFAAVVSSSSGCCGACSYRLFAESQMAESIEVLTHENPDWVHPRLRFYVGREDRLPVDQHELIALVAPRGCLISTGLNDNTESTWVIQHTYLAARPVYELLKAGDRLRVRWRPGGHETRASDIHSYLDWFDVCTGRGRAEFPEVLLHARLADWQKAGEKVEATRFPPRGLDDLLRTSQGESIGDRAGWLARCPSLRDQVRWALGEEPPAAANPGGAYGAEPPYRQVLLKRFLNPPEGLGRQGINFGDYVAGDLYYPETAKKDGRKVPAVIYLCPHSCARGYVPSALGGGLPHMGLAQNGFAVFAFDAIGTGYRIEEETGFYQRYPRWSLLGKMVRDVRAAVDALGKVPFVDGRRIYVVGYGLGGRVALHAAALDERIAGVASVAGFTPLRLDQKEKSTGGIARLCRWHVLQPRLDAFIGNEARIPYDFHEVLALAAPRPVLVVAPLLDRQNTTDDVRACVREADKVYRVLGAEGKLRLQTLDDYNRYSAAAQKAVQAFLKEAAGSAR